MFQGLSRKKAKTGRGIAVSLFIHLAAIGVFVAVSARGAVKQEEGTKVEFFNPPPPPPPPPAGGGSSTPKTIKKRPQEVKTFQQPQEIPKEIPKKQEPEEASQNDSNQKGEEGGVVGGVEGGVKGGVVGGTVGGVLGGVLGGTGTRLDFDARMKAPKMISGPQVAYTEKALENDIEGLLILKCVLTVQGEVKDCEVVQSLKYMDRAVIEVLQARKYSPVTLQGQPIEVTYTFRIRLNLPK